MSVPKRVSKTLLVLLMFSAFFACSGTKSNTAGDGSLTTPTVLTLGTPHTGITSKDSDGIAVYSIATTVGNAYTVKLSAKTGYCGMYVFNNASSWDTTHLLWYSSYYTTTEESYSFTATNSTYGFVVEADNASGITHTITVSDAVRPDAPTNFIATSSSYYHNLSWTAVTGATKYNIYYSTTPGTGTNGTKVTSSTTSYSHYTTSLYYYVVTAVAGTVESLTTAEVACGPLPASPTSFTATASDGQVTLTWNPVIDATSYNMYYYVSGSSSNSTTRTGITSPYIVTGLTNGTTYYFSVSAVNSYGTSSATSTSATPNTIPAAPTGVRATSSTSYNTIIWAPVAGISYSYNYNVYWSTTSGAGKSGTRISQVSSPYNHYPSGTVGTKYYYVVTSVNGSVESLASSEVSATYGVPTTNLFGIAGDKTVGLTWDAITGATGYNLYYSTTHPVNTATATKATTTSTYAMLSGLTNGTTLYFAVACVTANGEGTLSNELALTPRPALVAPQTFNFDDGTLQGWTGAPVSGSVESTWGVTSSAYHSSGYCVTDSPSGNYSNNENTTIFSPMIDVSAITSPTLTFWHKYAMESSFDYCYVEASVDSGVTWVALPTSTSKYAGTLSTWTQVSISLTSVKSANLLLRFRLKTDTSNVYDGWYIDDIVIQ
jgi:hypothetical protein